MYWSGGRENEGKEGNREVTSSFYTEKRCRKAAIPDSITYQIPPRCQSPKRLTLAHLLIQASIAFSITCRKQYPKKDNKHQTDLPQNKIPLTMITPHKNLITKHKRLPLERPWLAALFLAITIAIIIFLINLNATSQISFFCNAKPHLDSSTESGGVGATPVQLQAVLHYATTQDMPQQSRPEIQVTFDVLRSLSHSGNFLVFGLGHDSLMWSSFNANGVTFFLEEDPGWVQTVLTKAPSIRVHSVHYKTKLYDAKNLLDRYRFESSCLPPKLHLQGNTQCRLVLGDLADEVYSKTWDVIMIDGPKGYFAEAPGRMGAIFTAAVMAKSRTKAGSTHVVLHDVNRRVERVYAERFLCKKYLVKAVDRLWHFVIPPATKHQRDTGRDYFC
ncbi:uncharacterized protein [Phyllobates terribilis]|uniref:uncharacterized protein n=1 Tax=Phyllobates terribilis TaxID=111132 RepID=UPI003CCA9979